MTGRQQQAGWRLRSSRNHKVTRQSLLLLQAAKVSPTQLSPVGVSHVFNVMHDEDYARTEVGFEEQRPRVTVILTTGGFLVMLTMWLLLRHYFRGGVCHSTARLDGKTVLITGANAGIGKYTAMDMARRGARIIMACRDVKKAEATADDIRCQTGNENIVVYALDLASLKSIRTMAAKVLSSEKCINIVINNAGVMECPQRKTEDGFEMQFGVNHLGHFLLTNLLLETLCKSAPSRIVSVSSVIHKGVTLDFNDLSNESCPGHWSAYRKSKLANILFTREAAKRLRGTGVTAYAVHPGIVRTDLTRHILSSMPLLKLVLKAFVWPFMKSISEGAQTTIYCSVQPGLEIHSGEYFSDCGVADTGAAVGDDEVSTQLWAVSERLVGLK